MAQNITIDKLKEVLEKAALHNLNVALVGGHGVGKTEILKTLFAKVALRLKYYSAATLDPWADVVGIPVPCQESKTLEFFRPTDLADAEVVFFDEFNRAHPKVMNAVMEMIQFKSINGVPLPNLKMVWVAFNPPDSGYHVSNLDPALLDRFHLCLQVVAQPDSEYLSKKDQSWHGVSTVDAETNNTVVRWWEELGSEIQSQCSPRRLEYFGLLNEIGIDIKHAQPYGTNLPLAQLNQMLKKKSDLISKEDLTNPETAKKILKALKDGNMNVEHQCVEVIKDIRAPRIFNFEPFVREFSAESKAKFFKHVEGRLKKYVPNPDTDFTKYGEHGKLIESLVKMAQEVGLYG